MKQLLLLIALLCSLVSAQYYWVATNTDSSGGDIGHLTGDIASFQAQCTANPTCLGFNSDGWLKSSIEDPAYYPNVSFYYKMSTPQVAGTPLLVPKPQNISVGASTIGVSGQLSFSGPSSADLTAAFARAQALIFKHPSSRNSFPAQMQNIKVVVASVDEPLQMGVDESYTLDIPSDGTSGLITANTVYGVYHALQTLSQLVVFNFTAHSYQISSTPIKIVDAPRFEHRGVMVDTARHFEPIDSLLSLIDSLTYAKFNVLHWHVTDSQSFPMESTTSPNLWDGSFSEYERYTQDDMAYVIEYARQRGVRVMPEFDMPGHATSWCTGYPDICPSPTCLGPLNPATNQTFDLIDNFLGEVTGGKQGGGLFYDDLLHLGGDEVDTSCWTSTPSIAAWMQQNNITTNGAYMYFVLKVHQMAIAQGRNPVNWEEVFNAFGTQLDPKSIIHIWLDFATLARVVAAGYRAILSNNNVWYLDHLATTWEQFYLNEPFTNLTDPKQQALVLGGEVCMWGETVDTSDLFQTVWPRAAAAAERLWSAQDVNNTAEFHARLSNFRCLLNSRGIAAAPVDNTQARENPPAPASCYAQ